MQRVASTDLQACIATWLVLEACLCYVQVYVRGLAA